MGTSPTDTATVAVAADLSAGVAFVEGRYLPIAEARIPILDWGFTRSDVTYDVVHVWRGGFFRLEDHLDRFERSCAALRLAPPHDRAEVREILTRCVRLSGLRDAYVEMACTRGVPAPGSRDPRTCRNAFVAFAIPFVWVLSPQQQARGARVHVSSIPRIPPASVDPTVKNFHWGDLTRALFEAQDRGADTAILVDLDGFVSEGPGFNVFAVAGGRVRSPGGTVLEGITRRTVQELCRELGIGFEIGQLTPGELHAAQEVFLTSTAGGVMPVARVNGVAVGDGCPGPVTSRLRELYWARHEHGAWVTPIDYAGTSRGAA